MSCYICTAKRVRVELALQTWEARGRTLYTTAKCFHSLIWVCHQLHNAQLEGESQRGVRTLHGWVDHPQSVKNDFIAILENFIAICYRKCWVKRHGTWQYWKCLYNYSSDKVNIMQRSLEFGWIAEEFSQKTFKEKCFSSREKIFWQTFDGIFWKQFSINVKQLRLSGWLFMLIQLMHVGENSLRHDFVK